MFLRDLKNDKKFSDGLILLELVVALGIFLAVMTIGMGTVLAMYGLNKKGQALKLVMTNLNFAVESMAREIVVGTDYRCPFETGTDGFIPLDCIVGNTSITFCSSEEKQVFYRFNEGSKSIQRFVSEEDCDGNDSPEEEDWQRITAPEVEITNMKFFVSGATFSPTDECKKQPRAVILIEGVAGVREEEKSEFSIQTTVSQRVPKIDASCVYN